MLPAAVASPLLTAPDRIVIQHDRPADHRRLQAARYSASYNIASIPTLPLGLLAPPWPLRVFSLRDSWLRARPIADSQRAARW